MGYIYIYKYWESNSSAIRGQPGQLLPYFVVGFIKLYSVSDSVRISNTVNVIYCIIFI